MIDIKAIKAAAEADIEYQCKHVETPTTELKSLTVLALCDEAERLRNGMLNIANQSTEPGIQEFARSFLGEGK